MSEVRLIDANALKEHKFLTPQVKVIGGRHNGKMREQIIEVYGKGWNDCIDAIIDNAPTVEPEITNEDIQNAIKQGYKDGYEMARAKFERPRGEWVKDEEGKTICSNCGFECLYSEDGFLYSLGNYCSNCGAEMCFMRGKEE